MLEQISAVEKIGDIAATSKLVQTSGRLFAETANKTFIHTDTYTYTYIYTERERERERE